MDINKSEELKELGEILRQKRLELNLSLKEIENATSIRINYLHALEEGEMRKLISPIYAHGFFKQYASYLGLDGEQLIKDYPYLFVKTENQEFNYGIGTLEMRSSPGASVKWFPNFFWIGLFFFICLAAWYFAKLTGVI